MVRAWIFAAMIALGLSAGRLAHAQVTPVVQPHQAAPGQGCFSRQDQRVAVHQGRAIRLGIAMRAIRAHDGDELLRAELCRNSSGLVYVLTILSRTGQVSRAVVNAHSGAVIKDR
jgi:hypothetical protein